ncbi:hypothetical protein JCM3766R1_006029 [Sporobolomyces carnicolor]
MMRPTPCGLSTGSRARTHLFDVAPTPPPFRRPRPPARDSTTAQQDLTDVNPHLRVLKGSLRRCLLTQKVLPVDMMIPLKQLSIPSNLARASKGFQAGGMVLLPKGIQHPRFEEKVGGKGAWVMCHHRALQQLALKGSYKRINSQLFMPKNTQNLMDWTVHQLIKRVEQEVEMYCERAKSWPKLGTAPRFSPIARVRTLEQALECCDGGQIEMVLDLSVPRVLEEASEEAVVAWRKVTADGKSVKEVPVWRLGGIIRSLAIPGSAASATTNRSETATTEEADSRAPEAVSTKASAGDAQSQPDLILDEIKSRLDSTISLFERRNGRLAVESEPSTPGQPGATCVMPSPGASAQEENPYDFYVFRTPARLSARTTTTDSAGAKDLETARRMSQDLVDLWISCWRIGLWSGQGWAE